MALNLKLQIFFVFVLFVGFSIQQQTNSTICLLRVRSGYCDNEDNANSTGTMNITTTQRTLQLRYAYRNSTNICAPFLYSGCRGNANNFKSFTACRRTCGGRGLGD